MMAWTSPGFTVRLTPRRISLFSTRACRFLISSMISLIEDPLWQLHFLKVSDRHPTIIKAHLESDSKRAVRVKPSAISQQHAFLVGVVAKRSLDSSRSTSDSHAISRIDPEKGQLAVGRGRRDDGID